MSSHCGSKSRPNSQPRSVSSIIPLCCVSFLLPIESQRNETLCNHICSNLDQLLTDHPNALIIVTGDFNPSSTDLKLKDLTHTDNLTQMVNFPTRNSGIADWFLTNRPDFFTPMPTAEDRTIRSLFSPGQIVSRYHQNKLYSQNQNPGHARQCLAPFWKMDDREKLVQCEQCLNMRGKIPGFHEQPTPSS